jgi:hypothetical protein
MTVPIVCFERGDQDDKITDRDFADFRQKVRSLELDVSTEDAHKGKETFFADYPAVWTPGTCDAVRQFLKSASAMATARLAALENQCPEDGDEHDLRDYAQELQSIERFMRQLLSVVSILAECIKEQIDLTIRVMQWDQGSD